MALIVAGIGRVLSVVTEQVFRLGLNIDTNDHNAEIAFTQGSIEELRKEYPGYNALMCHSAFRQTFAGSTHQHYEFPLFGGRTQGYEVYLFKSGEFWLDGDGGFVNYAYEGKFVLDPNNSGHVIFSDPAPPNQPPQTPQPPKTLHTDGVYLVNSQKGNLVSSGFAWYSKIGNNEGTQPGAYVDVLQGGYVTWEGNSFSATFKDGDTFNCIVNLEGQSTAQGGPCGTAHNDYRQMTIYKDDSHVVYQVDGWNVHSLYRCY